MNDWLGSFLYTAAAYAAPVALCALGGQMTALAGRMNLGMEGMMLFSAFFSLYFAQLTQSLLCGLAAGVLICVLLGLLIAFLNQRLGADIYIAGLALNVLGTGVTTFLVYLLTGAQGSVIYTDVPKLPNISIPLIESVPYLNRLLSGHTVLDGLSVLLCAAMFFVLRDTAFGQRLRAVGLHARIAEAHGVRVERTVYAAYALCGLFCALAGAALSLPRGTFVGGLTGMTNGRGWLAMAIVILAGANPFVLLLAALVLGMLSAAGDLLQTVGSFSPRLVQMLPFAGALIAASAYSARRRKGAPERRMRK